LDFLENIPTATGQGATLPEFDSQEFKEVQLVLDGYTVSTKMAALARIADQYVMRKRDGQRVVVPTVVSTDHLTRAWTAFRRLAEIDAAIPIDLAAAIEPAGSRLSMGRSFVDLSGVDGRSAFGERITLCGRVLDDAGRPVPDTMIEIWQTNAAGRYQHASDRHEAPLDPNFRGNGRIVTDRDGCYRFTTIRPGSYPERNVRHVLRPIHIHFVLFGPGFAKCVFTEMYFSGDPLLLSDPVLNLDCPDAAARDRLVARFDRDQTTPKSGPAYRFDFVLGGSSATPLANVGKHSWLGS
jgi:protocatechuate 3,4-dioxygenase, beta subunit